MDVNELLRAAAQVGRLRTANHYSRSQSQGSNVQAEVLAQLAGVNNQLVEQSQARAAETGYAAAEAAQINEAEKRQRFAAYQAEQQRRVAEAENHQRLLGSIGAGVPGLPGEAQLADETGQTDQLLDETIGSLDGAMRASTARTPEQQAAINDARKPYINARKKKGYAAAAKIQARIDAGADQYQVRELWGQFDQMFPELAGTDIHDMDSAQLAELESDRRLGEQQDEVNRYAQEMGVPGIPLVLNHKGEPAVPEGFPEVLRVHSEKRQQENLLRLQEQQANVAQRQESEAAQDTTKETDKVFKDALAREKMKLPPRPTSDDSPAAHDAYSKAVDQAWSNAETAAGQVKSPPLATPVNLTTPTVPLQFGSEATVDAAYRGGKIKKNEVFVYNGQRVYIDDNENLEVAP